MKQQKHIRSNQERDTFISNLQRWDFVRSPMTFTYEPYKENRTIAQNRKMWALLRDLSRQVAYTPDGYRVVPKEYVEGYCQYYNEETWKDIMTAAWKQQTVVPGVDGSFVMTGCSTSKMKIDELSELIELIYAFGSEKGVEWSE